MKLSGTVKWPDGEDCSGIAVCALARVPGQSILALAAVSISDTAGLFDLEIAGYHREVHILVLDHFPHEEISAKDDRLGAIYSTDTFNINLTYKG